MSSERRGPQLRRRCGDVELSAVRVSATRHTPTIVGAPILTVKFDVTICHTGMYVTLAHARLSETQAVALQAIKPSGQPAFLAPSPFRSLRVLPQCHQPKNEGHKSQRKYFSSSEAASLF